MTECEAILLGREQIHGSANGTALANLCKSLLHKTDLHRKYILRCDRENGLQMIPYRRIEDEGFESDEDLTSLGSCDDTGSSIYVSDHALHVVKSRASSTSSLCTSTTTNTNTTTILNPRSSSHTSSTDVISGGSVSSVGTDSANSSGASDNDETDNSLSHNVNHNSSNSSSSSSSTASGNSRLHNHSICNENKVPSDFDKKPLAKSDDIETFAYHEIAFCHTDPSLPKIIVWVIKTKRQSKTKANEYSYGLEAVVFLCQSEPKFRALYKSFQEYSRRQKLEKPLRSRCKEEFHGSSGATAAVRTGSANSTASATSSTTSGTSKAESTTNNAVMYNLVQRVDTDGVTHIEVTRPQTIDGHAASRLLTEHANEPTSIISINTPDSGDVLKSTLPKKSDKIIESVIRTSEETDTSGAAAATSSLLQSAGCGLPPERPERKKSAKSMLEKEKMAVVAAAPNREKVVKGQFVRVSVDQKTLSSPSPRNANVGWLFGEKKPVLASQHNVLAYPSRLVWGRSDVLEYQQKQLQQKTHGDATTRRGRKMESERREHRHRSKSSNAVVFRRAESPKKYAPMPHRYVDATNGIQINNSLPNRFFGRLKELTTGHYGNYAGNNGHKFKRRNSIGDMTNVNVITYRQQLPDGKMKFDKNNSLAKSTPNLKSMIKNKNGKFYKEGYNENEPKKVTFSAYATVQVVD